MNKESDKKIVEGRKVIGMLILVLWNTNIIASTKRKMYSTTFQSVVLYGFETWTLKMRKKDILLALEIDFWRRSAGKLRLGRVRN